jgi:transcriptional regulator with PAS, ATPase and Fis domain
MIEPSRFETLHIVRKIKEKIRKWWNIELSFADATGFVVDHKKGVVIPPHSRLCAASLGCKEGFARCNRSIEKAVKDLSGSKEMKAVLVDGCHMGLHIIATPVIYGDRLRGALFACGFIGEEQKADRKAQVLRNAEMEGLEVPEAGKAYGDVPALSARDMAYFKDLLETTATEIVEFSRTVAEKEKRIEQLSAALGGRYQFGNIVGKSAAMQRLFSLLEKIVDSESTVLITGENGTGKELIARALHFNGTRKDKPFVAQNCSAMNDNLLESELFGHVRGAFTGATRDKDGLFKVADTGTFFLDEVGDMSPAMQVKLLRVIQEGTLLPVGGTRPDQVDVRIIAATNRNLKDLVARREFREDLYYRLNVLNIEVPPLRARMEDLPMLCEHFLRAQAEHTQRPVKRLTPEVMARFYQHTWPGNIRELENEIERLTVLSGDEETITAEVGASSGTLAAPGIPPGGDLSRFREKGGLGSAVAALEREMIQAGLIATHWNKTRLAAQLGVSRTTLIKKIKDYGIEDREPE